MATTTRCTATKWPRLQILVSPYIERKPIDLVYEVEGYEREEVGNMWNDLFYLECEEVNNLP